MAGTHVEWNEDLQRPSGQMEDFFDRLLGPMSMPRNLLHETWRPAVDLYELEAGLLAIAELPGVRQGDFSVIIQDGRLKIAGIRRAPNVERCKGPLQLEIEYGPFARVLEMPSDIDADAVEAHFRHGLLAVHIPRTQRKRIIRVQSDRSKR